MRNLLLSLIRGAEARPRRAVLIGVVCMLLGVASALTLRPGTAVEDMLPEASPSAAAMGRILGEFRLIDDLVLVVEPPAGSTTPVTAQQREALAAGIAEAVAGDPGVGAVSAGTPRAPGGMGAEDAAARAYLARHGGRLLDGPARATLAEALEPAALGEALARFRASLAAAGTEGGGPATGSAEDPLALLPRLLGTRAADADVIRGRARGPATIRIAATRPANDLPYAAQLVERVTEAARAANADGLTLTLTGAHAIADFTAGSVRRDMVVSLLVTMVSLSVLFLLVYRSGHALPLLLATVNGGLVVAFGVYALFGGSLSPVTAVCGAVLAGLGIDYGVHLLAARRFGGAGAAASRVGPSLMAACVTSCLGFGAVAFAGVRALTEFAALGVLGLLATLAMTVLFLPAALKLANIGGDESGGDGARGDAARPRLDPAPALRWLLARPRPPLFATSLVGGMVAAVLVLGGEVRFANDLEAMHARPNPPLEAQEKLTGGGAGPGHLLVLVEADPLRPGSLAARTRSAEAALEGLVRDDASPVAAVIGPGLFLPTGADDPPLPPPAEAVARFNAAAADAGFDPAALAGFRATLENLLSPPAPPTRAELDATPAGRLLPRADPGEPEAEPDAALILARLDTAWELLPDRAATLAGVRGSLAGVSGATATGLAVVGADMQAQIAAVLPRLLALAALAVVLWLAVVFRHPWDVFLALLPAVAGLAAVLAAVVATGTELHAANLIALPLTLGLGVDDGIFLVHLARNVRRASESPVAGVTPETLESAAAGPVHAVLITSVTTIAAFGSLYFTRSPAIASLGLLSAVGVAACLAASVFGLLPALAIQQRWLRERRKRVGG